MDIIDVQRASTSASTDKTEREEDTKGVNYALYVSAVDVWIHASVYLADRYEKKKSIGRDAAEILSDPGSESSGFELAVVSRLDARNARPPRSIENRTRFVDRSGQFQRTRAKSSELRVEISQTLDLKPALDLNARA